MEIIKVKQQGSGYLLNDNVFVPIIPGNRHYQMIQKWIAEGNTPEPEFTAEELAAKEALEAEEAAKQEALKKEYEEFLAWKAMKEAAASE